MVLRENDAVVAICDITSSTTGRRVSRGDEGVILKQSGWRPVSFKIRFTAAGTGVAVILDGVTEREITRVGAPLGNPFEGQPGMPGPGSATDPWWAARDPFAGTQA